MEKKIAIYPGSFNPFTVGHKNILDKALKIFDRVYVVFLKNNSKLDKSVDYVLMDDQMKRLEEIPNVHVCTSNCMTVDVCKQLDAKFIIRGIRDCKDFEYEKNISRINEILSPCVQTVFILSDPKYDNISSSMVRELISYNCDTSQFIF